MAISTKLTVQTPCAAEGPEKGEEADEEAEVTNAVDDKGFLGGVAGTLLVEVVADQQVGTETDPFPADEHHQSIVPQDQHQHGETEEVQVGEEAVEAFLAMHVAD